MQNRSPPLPEEERAPDARGAEGVRDVQGAPYTVGPELDPALRLEKELLTKIAGVIENNAETSGPINTDPERYASPPSPRVADSKALDYTMYYFRLYGPIMRTRGESCYVYGPRFVASRWVDERNADIALSAFYESVPATGIKALQEMDLMMRNGRDKFFDPTFGGFDLADFTRFRLEKRKLPPDGVCKTESFAVFVSW